MPSLATRSVFAIFALAYLVPLTAALAFQVVMWPANMPNGWPSETSAQAALLLFAVTLVAWAASTGVAWTLASGWVVKGRDWLAATPAWIRLSALLAPAIGLVVAAGYVRQWLASRASEGADLMPPVYWESAFRAVCFVIAWSLLFVVPVAIVVWPRRERRA